MRVQSVIRLAIVTACLLSLATSLKAQEIRKTLHDYWLDRPFTYQPSDPFVRSKLYRLQTGHFGMFYNCDGEECKRNSPDICWKTHYEKDFPTTMTCWQRIRHEADQVKQRLIDGSCACSGNASCGCSQCSAGRTRMQRYAAAETQASESIRSGSYCPECEGKAAATSRPTASLAAGTFRIRESQQQPLRSLTRSTAPARTDDAPVLRRGDGLLSVQSTIPATTASQATHSLPVIVTPTPRVGLVNRLATVRGSEAPPGPSSDAATRRR